MDLDDLLALLPDNTTGDIDAADLREIVSVLWAKSSVAGEITQTGEVVKAPAGWTCTRTEAGVYTVIHNMGTENYAVIVTPMVKADDAYAASIYETTADTFTYRTHSADQLTLHDVYTSFVVAVNP